MKTIGLIGGMSWESSLEYYRILNQTVKTRLGGSHSAKSLMFSVDFDEVERLQHTGQWDDLTNLMIDAARKLEAGGADLLVICTNTMHLMAPQVEAAVDIPLLHIADVTAKAVKARGQKTVALLGTRFTMEKEFYKGRLIEQHGLSVLIPNEPERKTIHRIIYQELCLGELRDESRLAFRRVIGNLVDQGAEGVILGCTEIPLIVHQKDYEITLYDTTELHAVAAVDMALES